MTLGERVLKARNIFPETYSYWIGLGALLGYTILFNGLFTIFLSYLNPLGGSQTVVSEERNDKDGKKNSESVVIQLREFLEHSGSYTGNNIHQRGMVLPFQPLTMAFNNISYYVDVPPELKQEGVVEDRLQLLVINVTEAFRPGEPNCDRVRRLEYLVKFLLGNVLVSVLSNYTVDTDRLLSALLVALVAHIEGIVQTVTLQVNASVDCLGGLWFCFGDSCVHFYGSELNIVFVHQGSDVLKPRV
ncbi:ABC transporter G family member 32 [Tanacetum coccineum]